MRCSSILSILLLALLSPWGASNPGPRTLEAGASVQPVQDVAAREEAVEDFSRFAELGTARFDVRLERITTAVPWPRGLVLANGELIVLARGRHRNAGGIDPAIPDKSGSLFRVDPGLYEEVVRGEAAGRGVRKNAEILVEAKGEPFGIYDPSQGPPIEATAIDRPYCTLAWDDVSQNFFICGYSGVDLPAKRFRKNATDSILRYDLRDETWRVVEKHDGDVVPVEELGYVVPNKYYPHHDPETNAGPHGWLNGPDGAAVVGRFLYAVGKDNHAIARYDLDAIREDPQAGVPASELVMQDTVDVLLDGEVRSIPAQGPSALDARDGYLYVGYRTASIILRFPIETEGETAGALIEPVVGELVAVFEPWSSETGRSANLIDITFNSEGEMFVACAENGRVWNIGRPDPESVFHGIDVGEHSTTNEPYVDLPALTGNPRARCGNIAFDAEDRLYICSGNYDSGTEMAGVIYRAVPE